MGLEYWTCIFTYSIITWVFYSILPLVFPLKFTTWIMVPRLLSDAGAVDRVEVGTINNHSLKLMIPTAVAQKYISFSFSFPSPGDVLERTYPEIISQKQSGNNNFQFVSPKYEEVKRKPRKRAKSHLFLSHQIFDRIPTFCFFYSWNDSRLSLNISIINKHYKLENHFHIYKLFKYLLRS